MSSFGQVPLNDIFEMLRACAPGHSITQTNHHYCVRYNQKTFPTLPRGEHGKNNPGIQRGVIKKMARALGIYECAKEQLSL
jgi:hypothetical protein